MTEGASVIGTRILAAGGAKLVGALAVACLVLGGLLAASLWGNWLQFQGAARMAVKLGAQVAASEARGKAELGACADTNARVVGTVQVLGDELHACRGEHQRTEERLALTRRQRDRARAEAAGQERMRAEAIRRVYETDGECRLWGDGAVCRARSDELLVAPAGAPE